VYSAVISELASGSFVKILPKTVKLEHYAVSNTHPTKQSPSQKGLSLFPARHF
jgi:hypothetical protein